MVERALEMKVSVIVPAFNEERLLPATLSGINASRDAFIDAGWESELIVCDNNSTDRTSELARAAGAKVVFEPINQIARARNSGAAHASGDWLIFVDADSRPTSELFRDVVSVIEQGRCLAGGSTVAIEGDHPVATFTARFWNVISRLNRWAAGSFMFCEAATFAEIGGFNQAWYAGEEIDFFKRLKGVARRKGRTVVILHRHPVWTSDRKVRLYTAREHLKFLLKTIATGRRTLRSQDDCFTWYDGRR
jgi:glycosyltransferase involved in cell wall biosynthesis